MSPVRELKESLARIAEVMAARDQVVEAAKIVARAARVRSKRHYTNVDRYLQQSVDALEALEKKT